MSKDKVHGRSQQVTNKEWQVCHIDGRGSSDRGEGRDAVGRTERKNRGRMKGMCPLLWSKNFILRQ